MTRARRLVEKARRNPAGLSFQELCALLERVGGVCRKSKGSHRVYCHDRLARPLVIQDDGGKAKPYQVRQVLDALDAYGLLEDGDEG